MIRRRDSPAEPLLNRAERVLHQRTLFPQRKKDHALDDTPDPFGIIPHSAALSLRRLRLDDLQHALEVLIPDEDLSSDVQVVHSAIAAGYFDLDSPMGRPVERADNVLNLVHDLACQADSPIVRSFSHPALLGCEFCESPPGPGGCACRARARY